ncbi:ABC transporter substrate-binding protein [Actinomadura craniellae]|uniref:ABC transporter substrate-binding protein n=1 Tax=Actinomadura craniellae TaxID=2231787 RepID=A0A365GW31_9ACTN|nr:MCE family protein [Actinomadura craniellae]RAY11027.1 ABC transporter substrate-binding protein [Actinomadura craniellae]
MTRRTFQTGMLAAVAAVTAAGCGLGVQDMTLPGGADVGDDPYTVTAQFANVLNLVPQSAVKVNDVAVGRVTKVTLPSNGWTATVTMIVHGDVRLPANASARLQQSSLLGEKYIELAAPPPGQAAGRLADGATIPVARTNRNTEVEEVFGALSMLLNGGGLAQLRTITTELNSALEGNTPQIKSLFQQINKLTTDLNTNRQGIVDALDGMNRLSATLSDRKGQLATVMDDLGPGLKTLESQRSSLVRMLESLDTLSDVAVKTIDRSQDDMIAALRELEPTLRKLSDAGRDLPRSLEVLFTYPFTDAVLPAIKGDYLNAYLTVTAPAGTEIIPPIKPGEAPKPPAPAPSSAPPLPLPPTSAPPGPTPSGVPSPPPTSAPPTGGGN